MELTLPSSLLKPLEREAADAQRTLHAHILKKLEAVTPPVEAIDPKVLKAGLPQLVDYLSRLPGTTVRPLKSRPTHIGGSS